MDSEVTTPRGVRGHSAVICHNAMHIYGGYRDLKGSSSELWTFDFGKYHLLKNLVGRTGNPISVWKRILSETNLNITKIFQTFIIEFSAVAV